MNFGKSLEKSGKKLLRQIFKLFINSEKIDPTEVKPQNIKRILIVRQDRRVGNLVLTTPLFELASIVFPEAKIDALVSNKLISLIMDNKFINELIPFNHTNYLKYPKRFIRLIRHLRKNKYDLVIESSKPNGSSFLNGLITYLSRAKFRVGFDKGDGSIFTNIHVKPDSSQHYYKIQQQLLNIFTLNNKEIRPALFVNRNELFDYQTKLNQKFSIDTDKKLIGIWIGARGEKKWDINNFLSVYNKLNIIENCFPILCFGIEEKKYFDEEKVEKANKIFIDDLNELKLFISSCSCFICGDTGPLHFSFALNIPTVGVFLSDNYQTYGYANGDNNYIIKSAESEKMIEEIIESAENILLK